MRRCFARHHPAKERSIFGAYGLARAECCYLAALSERNDR